MPITAIAQPMQLVVVRSVFHSNDDTHISTMSLTMLAIDIVSDDET